MKNITKIGFLIASIVLATTATSCKKDKNDGVDVYGTYSGEAITSAPEYSLDSAYKQNFVVSDLGDSALTMVDIALPSSISAKLSISMVNRTEGMLMLDGGNVSGVFFNVKTIGVSNTRTTFNLQGGKAYINSNTETSYDGFFARNSDKVDFRLLLSGTMTISDLSDPTPITVNIWGIK